MIKASKKLKLNKEDGKKVLKGAGIAMGGALLTYLAGVINLVDFGEYTPLAVAFGGVFINFGIKWLSGKK